MYPDEMKLFMHNFVKSMSEMQWFIKLLAKFAFLKTLFCVFFTHVQHWNYTITLFSFLENSYNPYRLPQWFYNYIKYCEKQLAGYYIYLPDCIKLKQLN